MFAFGSRPILRLDAMRHRRVSLLAAPFVVLVWGSQCDVAIAQTDTTPPTITVTLNPTSNAAGWHRTPVTVSFRCDDEGSGIQTCPESIVVSSEGMGQVVTGTAVDVAGNAAATSVTLNVDVTPPSLSLVAQVPSASPTQATAVVIEASTADNLAGVISASCNGIQATMSGSTLSCHVPLRKGGNVIVVDSIDAAGNSRSFGTELTRVGPPSALVVAPDALTLLVGDQRPVQVRDEYGQPIAIPLLWTSSDAYVAEVAPLDQSGTVVAKAPGEADLTVSAGVLSTTLRVTVGPGVVVTAGSTVWNTTTLPGYSLVDVVEGAPDALGPTALALEQGASGDSIVRALGPDGSSKWDVNVPAGPSESVVRVIGSGQGGALLVTPSSLIRLRTPGDGAPWRHQLDLGDGGPGTRRRCGGGSLDR